MSDNSSNASGGGIGFAGSLTILFVGLKLAGYISWSWWWVFAPSWIPLAIVMFILLLGGVGWLIALAAKN